LLKGILFDLEGTLLIRPENNVFVAEMGSLLASMDAKQIKLGIVTGATRVRAEKFLITHGWLPYFSVILGSENYDQPKPSPQGLLLALEQLGLSASSCAYVGDSTSDMIAARRAGMLGWGVTWKRDAESEEALRKVGAVGVYRTVLDLNGTLYRKMNEC